MNFILKGGGRKKAQGGVKNMTWIPTLFAPFGGSSGLSD
jgi:hypothetical protein